MSDKLSGFLVWSEPSALRSARPNLKRLSAETEAIEGWSKYSYTIEEQIPRLEMLSPPPFTHQLFIRWGADRLILVSNHYLVCDHFIDQDLRPALSTYLRKADIAVHELVLAMIQFRSFADQSQRKTKDSVPPTPLNPDARGDWSDFNAFHTLGYGSARTDAFGGGLQRIEFDGDDLAPVSLFTAAVPFVRFKNCGIRRKILDDKGFPSSYELLRIGKTGFLSFAKPGSERAQKERFNEVEGLLRNLNRFGFIK